MPKATIVEVFGTGSSQSATEVRISKAGLAAVLAAAGYTFTPTDANSADEIIAAIVCAGLAVLTPATREAEPLVRGVEFSYDPTVNFDSVSVNGQSFNRHTVEAAFYQLIPTPKLNPSDFK